MLIVAPVKRGAVDTAPVRAGACALPLVAVDTVHIRRRSADILDDAGKPGHRRHPLHLADDRVSAPALDDPALVVGEGAERTGAKTPPVADDREPDRFEGGYGFGVGGMRRPRVGEFVDPVELLCGERHRWRVLDDHGLWVWLRHTSPPYGILLAVVLRECACVDVAILLHLQIVGEDHVAGMVHTPPGLQVEFMGGAGYIGERGDGFPGGEAAGDRDHLALAHAEDEEVGRGVGEDGLPDRIRPVVVVGEPPEARLDTADYDRGPREEGVDPVGVDEGRPVGPEEATPGGVDVRAPALEVRRKSVHQRVDVPGRDREEEARRAQPLEVGVAPPVGLGDDADREPGILEHPAEQRGTEGGVVDVGVAGDQDDIEPVDPEGSRLRHRHGEERRLIGLQNSAGHLLPVLVLLGNSIHFCTGERP